MTLVDVHLGGENGFELAEQLHRAGLPAPSSVIMISTDAEQDLADWIATSPAIGLLSKIALTPGAIRDLVDGATGLNGGQRDPYRESSSNTSHDRPRD